MRFMYASAALVCAVLVSGCANSVRPEVFSKAEAGQLVRVEAGTVVSSTPVVLSSWVPFGLGPSNSNRVGRERIGNTRRGTTFVVRIDRNGEFVAVTQGDEIMMPAGTAVWVQYGDRVRLLPK